MKNNKFLDFSPYTRTDTFHFLNINTAASSELEQLPGIGPVKAMAIINYISLNGSLTSAADVQKVKGIGPGIWRKIEKLVVFHP